MRILVLAGALLVSPAFASPPCPPVAKIHGSADAADTFNLVFVPSGFAETELPAWRCAVDRILERLLLIEPFQTYSCAISAYRVDFAHCVTGTRRSSACVISTTSCPEKAPEWGGVCANAAGDPAFGVDGLTSQMVGGDLDALTRIRMDLGVQLCGDNPHACQLLGIDATGEEHARSMASCAPAADIVIVVANSGNVAGFETTEGAPPVVGITLDSIANGTPSHLLAHEIGHAFDLVDEYATGSGPSWPCGRNVADFRLCGGDGIPWADRCSAPNPSGDLCPATVPVSGCEVHGNTADKCLACDYEDSKPAIGLWEGAAYRACERYRPTEKCRMGEYYTADFCPVCHGLIAETLGAIPGSCPAAVTELQRLEVRNTLTRGGQEDWEMICSRMAEHGFPCSARELPDLNPVLFRAEIEVDGIRAIKNIDRVTVRGEGRSGAFVLERMITPDGKVRIRSKFSERGEDRLARRLASGPVRLAPDAVSVGDAPAGRRIKVRRAWIEWKVPASK